MSVRAAHFAAAILRERAPSQSYDIDPFLSSAATAIELPCETAADLPLNPFAQTLDLYPLRRSPSAENRG